MPPCSWSVPPCCFEAGYGPARDPSVTFYKTFPNCLKTSKNVVWQSADGRVTSDHSRVTVQGLFSKFSQIA